MMVRTSDCVYVVRCKDCSHCFELAATDPMMPYKGGKDGFFCDAFDMDFYTPAYNAATYYCADGVRRSVSYGQARKTENG